MRKRQKLFLLPVFILFLVFPVLASGIGEKQYLALLLINKAYQLILANYYNPPPGTLLLNSALKNLNSDTLLSENLSNEKAFKEFNTIFINATEDYKGDFNSLSMNIINTMVSFLKDKYSSILKPDEYIDLNGLLTEDKYTGLGITLAEKNGNIIVSSVFPDSPAFKEGLISGDIIVEINGEKIQKFSPRKVYNLLLKPSGEKIELKVKRGKKQLVFHMKTEEMILKDFSLKKLDNHIIYLKLYFFSVNTGKKVSSELSSLNLKSFKGCIIDLRDNPGGELRGAIDFAEVFLASEPVIILKNNSGTKLISANNKSPVKMPLVLLINKNTMSSSEIVASAFKSANRCKLIGEKTFGKGLVQGIFPLDEGFAIKLTVSEVFTSCGEPVNNTGIKPDIEILNPREQYIKAVEIIK